MKMKNKGKIKIKNILAVVLAFTMLLTGVPMSVSAAAAEELAEATEKVSDAVKNAGASLGYMMLDTATQLGRQNLQQAWTNVETLEIFGKTAKSAASYLRAAVTSGDWKYEELGDGTIVITDYLGNAQVVNIPAEIDGYKVTEIGESAFYSNGDLLVVTIPNGVIAIGNEAFAGCNKITTITLPSSVKKIGLESFARCSNLTHISLPEGLTVIGAEAFYNCSKLTNLEIPSSVISIDNHAFESCTGLTNIVIPEGIESLSDRIFYGCTNLRSVTIPNSVLSIGNGAFNGCSSLSDIYIPDSVLSIDGGAFQNCSSLKQLIIPSSVVTIGDGAFSGCLGLQEIVIPEGVLSIGDSAFYNCDGIKEVIIPSSVTYLGSDAFRGCIGLRSVSLNDAISVINSGTFYGCSALTSINFTDNIIKIDKDAFYGCVSLTEIILPDSVTSLGRNAFNSCSSVSNLVLSNNLITIPYGAFAGCNRLTSVIIPNSVTTINGGTWDASGSFENCKNLKYVVIPDSVTNIGNSETFYNCTKLSDIYYGGMEEQWDKISGSSSIDSSINIHFNSSGPELVDGFNQVIYRADDILKSGSLSNKQLQFALEQRGVCDDLLTEVDGNLMHAWDALQIVCDTIGNIASLPDAIIEKKDMYAACVLKTLQSSMNINLADGFQDMVSWRSDIVSILDNLFEAKYQMSMSQLNKGFKNLSKAEQTKIMTDVQNTFKSHKGISNAAEIIGLFSLSLDLFDSIESYLEYLYSGYVLSQMSDSVKMVIHEMYKQSSSSNNIFLKAALSDCVDTIDASAAEFLLKASGRLLNSAGYDIQKFFANAFWGKVSSQLIAKNPKVAILFASMKGSSILTNALFNTDEQTAAYGAMEIAVEIQNVAVEAYEALAAVYKNNKTEKNAAAMLSSVDMIFAALNVDFDAGYDFFNVADKSFVNRVKKFFTGCNDYKDIQKTIKSMKLSCGNTYHSVITGWVGNLEIDYPGSGLAEHYESIYEQVMQKITKEYTIKCPVDIYVYDKTTNELVATVIDNKAWCANEDITISVIDDEKTVQFYEDETNYRVEMIGNDTGSMDVTINEFDELGNDVRTVSYHSIPLTVNKRYETTVDSQTMQEEAYHIVDKETNKEISCDSDTLKNSSQKYKLTVVYGMAEMDETICLTADVTPGEWITLTACIPDGYTFSNWSSDGGVFENTFDAQTSFCMPNSDVTVTVNMTENSEKPAVVNISKDELVLKPNQQVELHATANPSGVIKWYSTNPEILTVDANGKITAKANGTAMVVAIVEETGAMDTCAVMVTETTVSGDVNGDGKVTAVDARWVLQIAAGTREVTESEKTSVDLNGDGKVTAVDARWVLQIAAGTRVL